MPHISPESFEKTENGRPVLGLDDNANDELFDYAQSNVPDRVQAAALGGMYFYGESEGQVLRAAADWHEVHPRACVLGTLLDMDNENGQPAYMLTLVLEV